MLPVFYEKAMLYEYVGVSPMLYERSVLYKYAGLWTGTQYIG